MATITGTFNSLVSGSLSGVIGTPGPQGSQGPAGPAGPAGPTFTGGPITSPITYTVGDTVAVFDNGDFYVEHNGSGAYGVVYINGLEASDGTNTILVQASGITFGDLTIQNTAFPGFAGYALESWVTNGFYPLTGNPSGFLTDAPSDGSQYARKDGAWDVVSGGAFLPLAGGSMDADATIALEDTVIGTVSEVGGYGFAVSSAADPNSVANVLFDRVLVKNESYQTTLTPTGIEFPDASFQTTAFNGSYLPLAGGTMTGAIVFDGTSGQYINKGNFDSGRGGNFGLSLVCSIGYEFNWQAGWLTTTEQNSTTPRPLYLDSLAGTTLRSWDSVTDTGTEVAHTGVNVSNSSAYYVNVAPDLVKVFEATNELGVSIAHDSIAIQHVDTPDQTAYFTNEYIGFEDMSGTPHSSWIEHDVITVQDVSGMTQMRATGLTFPDATTQTTAGLSPATAASTYYPLTNPDGFIGDAPSDGSQYARKDGAWDVVSGGGAYITSVTAPLAVTSGDLSVDLSGYLTDAPSDGSTYGRLNGTWAIPPSGVPEAPNDGLLYARINLGWAAIFGDAPSDGYNYGRYNGSWAMIDPPYTNSVWAYGHWTSANVTMLYDPGTMMYYNVLTF
jgi:hypothetical protein